MFDIPYWFSSVSFFTVKNSCYEDVFVSGWHPTVAWCLSWDYSLGLPLAGGVLFWHSIHIQISTSNYFFAPAALPCINTDHISRSCIKTWQQWSGLIVNSDFSFWLCFNRLWVGLGFVFIVITLMCSVWVSGWQSPVRQILMNINFFLYHRTVWKSVRSKLSRHWPQTSIRNRHRHRSKWWLANHKWFRPQSISAVRQLQRMFVMCITVEVCRHPPGARRRVGGRLQELVAFYICEKNTAKKQTKTVANWFSVWNSWDVSDADC